MRKLCCSSRPVLLAISLGVLSIGCGTPVLLDRGTVLTQSRPTDTCERDGWREVVPVQIQVEGSDYSPRDGFRAVEVRTLRGTTGGFALTRVDGDHALELLPELRHLGDGSLAIGLERQLSDVHSRDQTRDALLLAGFGGVALGGVAIGIGAWASTDEAMFGPDGDEPLAYSMLATSLLLMLGGAVALVASLGFGVSAEERADHNRRRYLFSSFEIDTLVETVDEHNRRVRNSCD